MIFVRLLTQTVFLAFGQIWTNKVRATLTTLGIIIGVAAVIAVVSATDGLQRFVLKEFGTIGASKVWIFPRFPDGMRDRYSYRQVRMTTKEADGLLANCPSLARLTPILGFSADVQHGTVTKQAVMVNGIRKPWHEIENREVIQGRPWLEVDEEERRYVCLVNDKAIGELGLDNNCVGQVILVGGRRFTIVGVVETKAMSAMFGGDEARSEVFIPYRTAEMIRGDMARIYVVAQTKSPELFEDAKAEASFFLRKSRHLRPEEPDTFGVEAIEQIISQFNRVAVVIKVFMACVVAISLLVGGIGIMNIMLASVSERTREIGLRKAMGARPAVILMQFLIEAVILCLVGGALGIFIGQTLILAIKMSFPAMAQATIPIWAILLSVLACAFVGIVSGMFPAVKAARLDPIEALRHE